MDACYINCSDDNPLGRDFTYIDDIIMGVMAAINYTPGQCGEKYNLGYGNPVSVPKLIEYLQEELGIEADIVSNRNDSSKKCENNFIS